MVSLRDFGGWGEILVYEGGVSLFISDRPTQCFGYEIPGNWIWGGQPGLLQAADGSGFLGVMLLSAKQLAKYQGDTIVARAATQAEADTELDVRKKLKVDLQPLGTSRFRATRWTATWPAGPNLDGYADKVFVEISSDWLAVVTGHPANSDEILSSLIESLGTTSSPEGYWLLLDERYPGAFSKWVKRETLAQQ